MINSNTIYYVGDRMFTSMMSAQRWALKTGQKFIDVIKFIDDEDDDIYEIEMTIKVKFKK
jgi:hypothetical protein